MDQALSSTLASAALTNAPLGVLILDQDGRIAWLNPTLEELLAIPSEQLLGQSAATVEEMRRELLFAPQQILFLEAGAGRPARWLRTSRVALPGKAGAIHYYLDATDQQNALEDRDRLHEELAQHTTRDAVTGLPNRQALLQGLEPLVSRSRRYHNPLSVIRLRIDNLTDIDTEFGKGNSETALTAVSQMLKDQMRWADLIGRFDNDEFLLVLPETAADAANYLLEKLRQRLSDLTPAATDGRNITLVVQFGVAGWQQGDDRAKLLRRAREQLEQ